MKNYLQHCGERLQISNASKPRISNGIRNILLFAIK